MSIHENRKTYRVHYRRDSDTGKLVATVPEFMGCMVTVDSVPEARVAIREALAQFVTDADSATLVEVGVP